MIASKQIQYSIVFAIVRDDFEDERGYKAPRVSSGARNSVEILSAIFTRSSARFRSKIPSSISCMLTGREQSRQRAVHPD